MAQEAAGEVGWSGGGGGPWLLQEALGGAAPVLGKRTFRVAGAGTGPGGGGCTGNFSFWGS